VPPLTKYFLSTFLTKKILSDGNAVKIMLNAEGILWKKRGQARNHFDDDGGFVPQYFFFPQRFSLIFLIVAFFYELF